MIRSRVMHGTHNTKDGAPSQLLTFVDRYIFGFSIRYIWFWRRGTATFVGAPMAANALRGVTDRALGNYKSPRSSSSSSSSSSETMQLVVRALEAAHGYGEPSDGCWRPQ